MYFETKTLPLIVVVGCTGNAYPELTLTQWNDSVPSADKLQALKNDWLYSHIDVPFPTSESKEGWAIYQKLCPCTNPNHIEPDADLDWHWVSFHKMTVWFAQYYAKQLTSNEQEQHPIVEFLTQISVSPDDPLKLFFVTEPSNSDIIAAGFCTLVDQKMVVIEQVGRLSHQRTTELLEKQSV